MLYPSLLLIAFKELDLIDGLICFSFNSQMYFECPDSLLDFLLLNVFLWFLICSLRIARSHKFDFLKTLVLDFKTILLKVFEKNPKNFNLIFYKNRKNKNSCCFLT